jgi:uncharacterized protein YcfJ
MKLLTVIALSFLVGCTNLSAQEGPSNEQILGAIAGGAIGSTIGDGDGRKAAMVLGAIIGYRNGEIIFGRNEKVLKPESYTERRKRFEGYCVKELPVQYSYDYNLARSWIRGCIDKLQKSQRELERQAYIDGLTN